MHFSTGLGVTVLALSASWFPSIFASPTAADGPSPLKAVSASAFESAFGIQRRAAEQYSSLDPQAQEKLYYARHGGNGQLVFANMTLYAEHGLQILLLERFEGLTKSIDCKGDDGTMSLTFNSQAAYQYALKTWAFINQAKDNKFLLIANHPGCGPDDQRQPYLISNIRDEASTLTTFLTAQVAKFSEVAGTYDLDFGHTLTPTASNSPSRRDFIGDATKAIQKAAGDVSNTIDKTINDFKHLGNFNLDKSETFSVAAGTPNKATNILDNSGVKIDCVNCYTLGKVTLTGHVSTKNFIPQDVILNLSPSGFSAELELATTISKTVTPNSLNFAKTLFSAPIPGAGIEIPEIFTLGAIIEYDVGVSVSFTGSATVKYGFSATVPDTAHIVADLETPSNCKATGFEGGQVTPNIEVTAVSASVGAAAFSQPKLSFGIELIGVAKFEADFTVKLPEISAALTASYNPAGVCTAGGSKTGVNLTSNVGIQVDFNLDAGLGSANHKLYSTKLWGTSYPLAAKCYPLDIPGLGPASSKASVPPVVAPTKPPVQSVVLSSVTATAVPIESVPAASSPVAPPVSSPKVASKPVPTKPVPSPSGKGGKPGNSKSVVGTAIPIHTGPSGKGPSVPTAGSISAGTTLPLPTTSPGNGTAPIIPRRRMKST